MHLVSTIEPAFAGHLIPTITFEAHRSDDTRGLVAEAEARVHSGK